MTGTLQPSVLLPLMARLKACPARDHRLSEKRLIETWGRCKQIALEPGDAITPAIMAGVILHDPESYAPLLSAAEHAQLQALGKAALERYLQSTNPPNKLGKLIAGIIKK